MKRIWGLVTAFALVSCTDNDKGKSGEQINTLYRGGVLDKSFRLNKATFDTRGENLLGTKRTAFLNENQKSQLNRVKF